jgi:hypothetical protein
MNFYLQNYTVSYSIEDAKYFIITAEIKKEITEAPDNYVSSRFLQECFNINTIILKMELFGFYVLFYFNNFCGIIHLDISLQRVIYI